MKRQPFSIVVCAFILSASCATFQQASHTGPDEHRIAIDANRPISAVRWSFLWGEMGDLYSPLDCADPAAPPGACKTAIDPCGGKGTGQVEVKLLWYSLPLAAVTLGAVMPARVTFWCATEGGVSPHEGP